MARSICNVLPVSPLGLHCGFWVRFHFGPSRVYLHSSKDANQHSHSRVRHIHFHLEVSLVINLTILFNFLIGCSSCILLIHFFPFKYMYIYVLFWRKAFFSIETSFISSSLSYHPHLILKPFPTLSISFSVLHPSPSVSSSSQTTPPLPLQGSSWASWASASPSCSARPSAGRAVALGKSR